jgi:hypothetical protein
VAIALTLVVARTLTRAAVIAMHRVDPGAVSDRTEALRGSPTAASWMGAARRALERGRRCAGGQVCVAQCELGAEMSIGALSRGDIERFNACERVTLLESGRPKSQLTIDRTRRVLRLALAWSAQTKLIETSPAPPDAKAKKTDTPASEPTPVEKKPRKRKQAIVLEVSQADAERAVDGAESDHRRDQPRERRVERGAHAAVALARRGRRPRRFTEHTT